MYQDWGTKDPLELSVGAAWDGIFGSGIALASDTAGVIAGTGTTILASETAAAPVLGVIVGVGAAGYTSYKLTGLYNEDIRKPLIQGTIWTIETGEKVADAVSEDALQAYDTASQYAQQGYDTASQSIFRRLTVRLVKRYSRLTIRSLRTSSRPWIRLQGRPAGS